MAINVPSATKNLTAHFWVKVSQREPQAEVCQTYAWRQGKPFPHGAVKEADLLTGNRYPIVNVCLQTLKQYACLTQAFVSIPEVFA